MIPFLPLRLINKSYEEEFLAAFRNFLDTGWYIQGPFLKSFEDEFAAEIGTKYCSGVSNGLDALELSLRAAIQLGRLKEGEQVLVPANTFIASILAVLSAKLHPVLVEPDPNTFLITPEGVLDALNKNVKAVMPVHLYGQMVNLNEIREIARDKGLFLIEDAAQSHGAMRSGKKAGSLGDVAAFSFYPGKNLGALGDAGAVTTDDEELWQCINKLRNYGSSKKYHYEYQGRNCRLDDLQAAFLSIKLKSLREILQKRTEFASFYLNTIDNPYITLPTVQIEVKHAWHLFVIRTQNRPEFMRHMMNKGIETAVHYPIPPHKQVGFPEFSELELPVSTMLHREVVSLPLHEGLTAEEVEYIAGAVNSYKEK